MDGSLRELLQSTDDFLHHGRISKINVNRPKLKKYEKKIVEYLQRTDRVHPCEDTLKLHNVLLHIWSNMYTVCRQP